MKSVAVRVRTEWRPSLLMRSTPSTYSRQPSSHVAESVAWPVRDGVSEVRARRAKRDEWLTVPTIGLPRSTNRVRYADVGELSVAKLPMERQ